MSNCIESPYSTDKDGYAYKCVAKRTHKHHRVAYAEHHGLTMGDIQGKVIMHLCDNPPCVNPAHLEMGTAADNVADRKAKGRSCKGEEHHKAKLTAKQVAEIKDKYRGSQHRNRPKTGPTMKELGEEYGVTDSSIRSIILGKSWV